MSSAVRGARERRREQVGALVEAPRRSLLPLLRLPWTGPAVVVVVAALTRFWALGSPRRLIFDETYYVKDAWSLWHLGYEGQWPTGFDAQFVAGRFDDYSSSASFPAHPPLGKWIIGLGEVVAGGAGDPVGWRLSVAVAGVLAVAVLMLVAHRLFANAIVTTVAGGLFAIDSQAIVLSRIALLDNLVMLLALLGFAAVLEDRFYVERRFGWWLFERAGPPPGWGPTVLWRPWLIAAGLAFGLCSGVKWSGLYFLVAFAAYAVGVDLLLRRRAGFRRWALAGPLKQAPVIVASMVGPALFAYLASWTGWFVTRGGFARDNLAMHPDQRFRGALAWVPETLQNLWSWHTQIYAFHVGLDRAHPYASPAIGWPIMARPTFMDWDQASAAGRAGCRFGQCASAITDIANPLIWYGGWAAAVYLLVRFIMRREWQAGLVLMGVVAGYVPWLAFPNRTIFFFYSIVFEPYLILCFAATIGLLLVPSNPVDPADEIAVLRARASTRTRRILVWVVLGAAVALAAFFYPLTNGMQTPYWFFQLHTWSRSWI